MTTTEHQAPKAYKQLKKETIKEEILTGIETGLKEMAERKRNGRKAKTLEELIDEF